MNLEEALIDIAVEYHDGNQAIKDMLFALEDEIQGIGITCNNNFIQKVKERINENNKYREVDLQFSREMGM
jgi:hypothetical protein